MTKLSLNVILWMTICCAVITATPIEPKLKQNVAAPEIYAANKTDYRLPGHLKPTHYDIRLKPYLFDDAKEKQFTFEGYVEIVVSVVEDIDKIVLHSKNLNYTKREYSLKSQTESPRKTLPKIEPNEDTDIIVYNLNETLKANQQITLYFTYTGKMEDDMRGFYRSSYTDKRNKTKWLGSTQFQTNHARRAFPSFDEPKFKATFNITLVRPKHLNSFSNSELLNTEISGDDAIDVYKKTPIMSTYLVAFMISDFSERSDDGKFSIIARSDYYDQTIYSHEVGEKLLKVLDDYTNLTYYELGINKMHMAALPDFSAGAMENWGLLTYRERNLLMEEGSTTLSAKQAIAAVIAHEQAHMWFGDLVTCEWWSYAWLNEGFARYFQYHATAQVENENELESQFVVDQIHSVMGLDATNKTNPMTNHETYTPADLSRQFNSITYNKGASVIRMIRDQMGEDKFQEGLRNYLKNKKEQTAIPDDLLNHLQEVWPANNKNYSENLFKSFTEQVGYPVITFIVNNQTNELTYNQKRFLLDENDGSNKDLLYTVPITYTTNIDKNFVVTMSSLYLNNAINNTIKIQNNITWLIGNLKQSGYYRVNYDWNNWMAIRKALYKNNWDYIHEVNRAQIVDDLFNLARASINTYNSTLHILEYLETETHYLPWTAAFNGYSFLTIRLGNNTNDFAAYIKALTDKVYKKLGFEEKTNDTVLDIYNRAKVISMCCKFGHKNCISEAQDNFNKFKTNNIPVPVNIRSAVYCTVLREGNETEYNVLFEKFLKENVATEQTLILGSLGCVKNQNLVEKHFNNIVSEHVRRQDRTTALSSLYTENNENVDPVFKLVTDNFEKLKESLGGYGDVANVIANIAARFTNEDQEKKLKEFNKNNGDTFGNAKSTLISAEKTVRDNLVWSERKLGDFRTYLRLKNSATSINAFTIITLMVFAALSSIIR